MSSRSLAIFGVTGRMGRTVLQLALSDPLWKVVGGAASSSSTFLGRDLGELVAGHQPLKSACGISVVDTAALALEKAAIAIDFSTAAALQNNVEAALRAGCPLVVGTTGLTAQDKSLLTTASHHIPLLYAANFSLGVHLLHEMVSFLGEKLEKECYIELFETHHESKKDRPSGTALSLAAAIGLDPSTIHATRSGEAIGEHRIVFICGKERLELKHVALDRALFAAGALRAASWLLGQRPGLYALRDMITWKKSE